MPDKLNANDIFIALAQYPVTLHQEGVTRVLTVNHHGVSARVVVPVWDGLYDYRGAFETAIIMIQRDGGQRPRHVDEKDGLETLLSDLTGLSQGIHLPGDLQECQGALQHLRHCIRGKVEDYRKSIGKEC